MTSKKSRKRRPKRWAVSVGTRGVNRVRAYEHENGRMYLQWRVAGETKSEALGTQDREEACAMAEVKAAQLRTGVQAAAPAGLTLGELFDRYLEEVAKRHTNYRQRVRAFGLLGILWGRERLVSTLSMHDVDAYVAGRSSGSLRPPNGSDKGVRARAIEEDLQGLRAALNWATVTGDGRGGYLLERNPIRGFKLPKEPNVQRARLEAGEYQAMLARASAVDRRFYLLLVLCFETGHRLSSVRQLAWSEIDLMERTILWRGAKQKNGVDHVTPMTDAAHAALAQFRTTHLGPADFVFANRSGVRPVGREQCYKWWNACRQAAALDPHAGGAFHMFRRELASELASAPLAIVKNLLGSKNPQVLVSVYQQPNLAQLRDVLGKRERFALGH